jgi:hypothetical protein
MSTRITEPVSHVFLNGLLWDTGRLAMESAVGAAIVRGPGAASETSEQ